FRSKYINLTAIALDWKVSGGVYEERPAIVFYVIRKGVIPLGDQHFPKIIDGIETDVREGIYRTTGTDSHYCRSYEPVITLGCSIGNSNNTSAGTLGCFAKDSTENTYILTCQHVLCLNEGSETGLIFQPAYIDYVGMLKSEKKITIEKIKKAQYIYKDQETIDLNSKKLETIKNDLESAKKKDTLVGSFYKGLRDNYKIDDKNYGVDAAIASLVETINGNFRKFDPVGLPISDFTFKRLSHEPINLSCTIDIINNLDSVDISQPVFKVGRTSGLTIGHIKETILSSILLSGVHNAFHQQERIFGRYLLKEIKHKGKSIFPPKWLDRQITVMNDGMFTEEGDSGCIWFNKSGAVIAMGHGNLFTNIAIYSIGSPIHA
ncbi:13988_t:CDS:1, partial [Funneliformis caledonium]